MVYQNRTVAMNLQEVFDALDLSFIADKLRRVCYMLAHQKVYNVAYTFGFIEEILAFIDQHPHLLEIPAIAIYYYGYKATVEPKNESHFQSLKELIFQHEHLFPHLEANGIYLMALNYCIGRTNAGFNKYRRESFELYRRGVENGVLIEKWANFAVYFPQCRYARIVL